MGEPLPQQGAPKFVRAPISYSSSGAPQWAYKKAPFPLCAPFTRPQFWVHLPDVPFSTTGGGFSPRWLQTFFPRGPKGVGPAALAPGFHTPPWGPKKIFWAPMCPPRGNPKGCLAPPRWLKNPVTKPNLVGPCPICVAPTPSAFLANLANVTLPGLVWTGSYSDQTPSQPTRFLPP